MTSKCTYSRLLVIAAKMNQRWAVVVAQLVERSLLISKRSTVRIQSLAILITTNCIEKTKIKKKQINKEVFMTNIVQFDNERNKVDGMLGIRTRDCWMVGLDKSTELWWAHSYYPK